ncbi:MAG: DUF4236 domain-containing protein [Balneolaceae bacterium]|nr:DUF4236 domain-containing protein [Balneolaceae bacterium]
MGFFLRKAFRAGPVRLNLSKGGLGVSAGVTGARIGLNRQGAYLYGGRHGLYYREQLTRKKKGKRNASGSTGSAPADLPPVNTPGREDIFVDTGTTYPPVYDLIEPHPFPDLKEKRGWFANPLLWIVALGTAIAAVITEIYPIFGITGFLSLLILFGFLRDRSWRKRGKAMVEEAAQRFEEEPSNFDPNLIHDFVNRAPARYNERFLPDLYLLLIQIALENPDEAHIFAFNKLEKQIPVSEEFMHDTKKAILTRKIELAMEDHLLTEAEEEEIRELIRQLYLPEDFIFEELQYLDLASSIRKEMDRPLEPINGSIPLVRGESCFAEFNDVRLLEERVLDRFQKNRVQYRKIGFEIQLEGTLTITDRRIVITGRGSREYRLNRILNVITDVENNIIELVIADRKNPVFLSSAEPLLLSARLERILERQTEEQAV